MSHNNSTLFDVDAPSSNNLAFQDFSSTTIAADIPSGRISPSGSPHVSRGNDLYATGGSIGSSLSGATKSGGVLNLDFYTGYFDVDTMTVLTRCWKTLVPREDYVAEVLAGVPDLYGPFWVPTTLIFSLFLTSSLSSSIYAYLAGKPYEYDFTRLGAAVTLVYMYFLGLPLLLWAALKYWAGVDERSPVEIVSVYGYAATVWILTSWLTLIPVGILQAALVITATSLSLWFLLRNLYPIISSSQNTSAKLLVIVIAVLHLGMGLALWLGFMVGGSGVVGKDSKGKLPPVLGGDVGETPPTFF
ncbi:Yip1-domain-containing protein [Meredithblackwellia eburnea MCA 4105]